MPDHFDWTDERVAFLKANYRSLGRSEIARRWGVKPIVIGRKAFAMGLSEPVGKRQGDEAKATRAAGHNIERWFNWSPERLAQLKAEYHERTAAEFADMWGMTEGAITQRAYRMGLTGKAKQPKRFTSPAAASAALVGVRGDSLRVVETVAARKAKPKQCAWIDYGNRGNLGNRCSELAIPGRAWCPDCQAKVDALRSEEAA